MTQTASGSEYSGQGKLYLAMELGWGKWKLAFKTWTTIAEGKSTKTS